MSSRSICFVSGVLSSAILGAMVGSSLVGGVDGGGWGVSAGVLGFISAWLWKPA